MVYHFLVAALMEAPLALSLFVCASLSEDRYGVVQRDIPRILEALLSFLSALEDYQAELSKLIPPADDVSPSVTQIREEMAPARDVLNVIGDGKSLFRDETCVCVNFSPQL